jgi:hypothetical protein
LPRKLDEVANAEGCPIIELSDAQVHFALTDDGELALDGLGDEMEANIFDFCYPDLAKARLAGRNVAQAVASERARDDGGRVEPDAPATERGRRIKADLDMPTTLVNRLVSTAATRRLRSFKPRGKPS